MTVMSFKSKDAGSVSTQPFPHFECYLGAGDDDALVSSRRAYDTRGRGHPSSSVDRTGIPDLPADTAGYSVSITPANNDNNAFGVFSCTAKEDDREVTTIMTIFLHANAATTLMTTILGPLYREIHWSSTKFLAIPETAVTFFPAMLQNRRRTSSHNRVKHKSNFSPTKYYQSQSKISFIATNSWRNELPQRRQKFFTFSEIKTENCTFTAKSSSNF
ncbi:hypothetical protein BSL78_04914 [Apostichopus japonicus]|uniref:Uncharacterized protein n=1 Tax=Stichopus japonicus TaxID=307972 RepID=A0A2G8LDF3_STIJA|nr:hypothetical protein BSL78_04914 [Apostichopus japonicus]